MGYHVYPHRGEWKVRKTAAERALMSTDSREEAWNAALKAAAQTHERAYFHDEAGLVVNMVDYKEPS